MTLAGPGAPGTHSESVDAPLSPETGTAAQVRGSVASYVTRVLLGAIMGVLISRALAPAGRGAYSVVVIIASVATILGHLSIGNANVAFWSAHRAAIPSNNLWLGPPLGALAALIVGGVVMALGPQIVPVQDAGLLVLALLTVPVSVLIMHLTTVTLLLGQVHVVNRAVAVAAIVQCAGIGVLYLAGGLSATSVVWIWALCGALPLPLLLPTLRPHFGRTDVPLARRMIAEGAEYHLGQVALFLLQRIGALLLNGLASVSAVGLYTLAVTIGEMAYAGTDALSQALLRRQAEEQIGAAADLAARTVRVAGVVALGSVAAICAAAPFVVPVVYGEAFRDSVAPLFALAPGLVLYGATRPLIAFLLRQRRPRLMSGISYAALGVNVTLNLVLIPALGIVGCAIATTAGYVALSAAHIGWFHRASGVPIRSLLPRWQDVTLIATAARGQLSVLSASRR
jgi:O-antigen/teichoic acid export membrane protein